MGRLSEWVKSRNAAQESAHQTYQLLAKSSSVGFCDDPDTLSEAEGVVIEAVAIIHGRKSIIKFPGGSKSTRGSAIILRRTFSNGTSDYQIAPNDTSQQTSISFTIDSAHDIFPPEMYQLLLNAISINSDHRKAKLTPPKRRRGIIFRGP